MSLMGMFNEVGNSPAAAVVENNVPALPTNPYQLARQRGNAPHVIPYYHGEYEPAHFGFYCTPYKRRDNKEIFVYGERPSGNLSANTMPKTWYRSMLEVLDHPGDYSWILFEGNRFVAAKFMTPAEIMSKHKNMYRNRPDKILAAGECRIGPNRTVVYNFESGTFMRPIIENFKYAFGVTKDYRPIYRSLMEPLWESSGATKITYTNDVLLSKHMNEYTPLGNYTKLGYKFHAFDTKQECEMYRNSVDSEAYAGGARKRTRRIRKAYSKTRRGRR